MKSTPRSSYTDEITDEKLLEHLLRYSQGSPDKTARQLLSSLGNIANVIDAPPRMLTEQYALSKETVELIRLVSEVQRRYLLIRSRSEMYLRDRTSIAQYLMPLFTGQTEEVLYLLSLNGAHMVLGCTRMNNGNTERVELDPRTLISEAIQKKASYVVLAHNHPAGTLSPSSDDIRTTNAVRDLLEPLKITLLDHIIFANDSYLSMRECGYFHFYSHS